MKLHIALLLVILGLAVSACNRAPRETGAESDSKPRTVIYDPKAMARIEGSGSQGEFTVKDYYVNVLVVEVPVEKDAAWLRQLPSVGELKLAEVRRADGQGALSAEQAKAYRGVLTEKPPAWGRSLRASWPADSKGKTLVEVSQEKPLSIAEAEFFRRLPGWFDRTGHGMNGWISLPPGEAAATQARLKKILEAAGKVAPQEKVLLFVVPVGSAEAPLLLVSSGDLEARGGNDDVLPTLQEAMHSEPETKEAGAKGVSLYRSFFDEPDSGRVGVAYFLGGRTAILYRPYLNRQFDKNGVNVVLYSKSLYDRKGQGFLTHKDYYRIPKDPVFTKSQFKATGIELIEFMMASGKIGASIGESAFLQGLERKVPMVAVAELGYDAKEKPGHAMVLCKNLPYDKPEDLKGKKFGSRRSAGGDELMLREFVAQAGLDPNKDVTIFGNMPDDKLNREIANGGLDGMYAHLMSIPFMPKHCRVIRKLDWVNPEISSALLVFPRDWLAAHRDDVKKTLKILVQHIAFEKKMTRSERRNKKWKNVKGVEIEMDTDNDEMQLPTVRALPTVRVGLLRDLQKLFRKHGVSILERDVDIAAAVDNSILEEIGKELGVQPDGQ